MYAVSSISFGTPDINPSRIQTARGTLKRQLGKGHGNVGVNKPECGIELKKRKEKNSAGAILLVKSQKNTCLSPIKWYLEKR